MLFPRLPIKNRTVNNEQLTVEVVHLWRSLEESSAMYIFSNRATSNDLTDILVARKFLTFFKWIVSVEIFH